MAEHVIARLDELGETEVKRMHAAHEFPSNWAPYIRDWLVSKRQPEDTPKENGG